MGTILNRNTLPLLLDSDNKYVIMNSGDELSLEFDALKLPSLKKDWKENLSFTMMVG